MSAVILTSSSAPGADGFAGFAAGIAGDRLVGTGRFLGAFFVSRGTAHLLVEEWSNSTGFDNGAVPLRKQHIQRPHRNARFWPRRRRGNRKNCRFTARIARNANLKERWQA